jgi:hypothetical protein
MTVNGTYFNLERFLNAVETMKRVMLVTGMDIKSSGTPTLVATINTRVFLTAPAPKTAAGTTGTATAPAKTTSPTTVSQ